MNQYLQVRTLQGYGLNGLEITFPNGTVVSLTHNMEGCPELLIEGDAVVTRLNGSIATVMQ